MEELHKVYEIKTVSDFDQVPLERMADCINEFAAFICLRRMAGALSNQPALETFRWVDDGKKEVIIKVALPSAEVPLG